MLPQHLQTYLNQSHDIKSPLYDTNVIIKVPFLLWLSELFHKPGRGPILSPELQNSNIQWCSVGKLMTAGQRSSQGKQNMSTKRIFQSLTCVIYSNWIIITSRGSIIKKRHKHLCDLVQQPYTKVFAVLWTAPFRGWIWLHYVVISNILQTVTACGRHHHHPLQYISTQKPLPNK